MKIDSAAPHMREHARHARARHLRETVGLAIGGSFHLGMEDGLRGIATITALSPRLTFAVAWEKTPQARLPLTVLVGLPEMAVKESIHRIERALVNLGYGQPQAAAAIAAAARSAGDKAVTAQLIRLGLKELAK